MKYILVRTDGAFVADSAKSNASYTRDITKAKIFYSEASAKRDQCGNESIVKLSDINKGI